MYNRVYVSNGMTDFDGYVSDTEDMDGTFRLIDADTGETYSINGWQATDIDITARNVALPAFHNYW